MTTRPNVISNPARNAAAPMRLAQLGLAALLGLFVLATAGFAQIDAVHNAAHDARHSFAFPCH